MERNSKNISRLIHIFCCPLCRGHLSRRGQEIHCRDSSHGPFRSDDEGRYYFIHEKELEKNEKSHFSGVNSVKSFFKRYPRFYYFLWYVFCPVLLSGKRPKSIVESLPEEALILNLGSGPRRIHPRAVNVDMVPFTEVDVVANAEKLPFPDNSVDAVLSESLLEHVPNPRAVVQEMMRVLKPGGILYASVPFLTPYHASPDDFNRWTRSGLRELFKDCEPVEEGTDGGPWSAFLVFWAYWFGALVSLGLKRAAPFFGLFFMLILGPLKIFDFIFARLPGAEAVAAQLYFVGQKR